MTEISEKVKRKLQADGMQGDIDGISVSRNALRRAKKNANRKTGSHILANELSHGRMLDIGHQLIHGGQAIEPVAQYSETAQEIKMRKAAEKRARRSMQ
jgi:hypothetical protein